MGIEVTVGVGSDVGVAVGGEVGVGSGVGVAVGGGVGVALQPAKPVANSKTRIRTHSIHRFVNLVCLFMRHLLVWLSDRYELIKDSDGLFACKVRAHNTS